MANTHGNWVRISLISLILLLVACGSDGDSPTTQQGNPNSATLTWEAPTTNEDGTPLEDLAGYKVHYGTISPISNENSQSIHLDKNVTNYTLSGLNVGTYYFVVTAYDTSGNESSFSEEVSKVIEGI